MSGPSPSRPPKSPADLARWALFASVLMFLVAFAVMVGLALFGRDDPGQAALFDVCKWIIVATATAVVGLLGQGRR